MNNDKEIQRAKRKIEEYLKSKDLLKEVNINVLYAHLEANKALDEAVLFCDPDSGDGRPINAFLRKMKVEPDKKKFELMRKRASEIHKIVDISKKEVRGELSDKGVTITMDMGTFEMLLERLQRIEDNINHIARGNKLGQTMTTAEVMKEFKIGADSLRTSKIPREKWGKSYRYQRADVEKYMSKKINK